MTVGDVVRERGSSTRYIIVDLDARFIYVKRADTPKKRLTPAGAYLVGREDFRRTWTSV